MAETDGQLLGVAEDWMRTKKLRRAVEKVACCEELEHPILTGAPPPGKGAQFEGL